VARVPNPASRSVIFTRGCRMIARAAAIRSGKGAGGFGFRGLPGLTSHQT